MILVRLGSPRRAWKVRAILKASSFELAAGVGEGEDRLVADHDLRQALGELGDIDVRDAGVERDELERP